MSELIDFERLNSIKEQLKAEFNDPKKPFKWLCFESFFCPEAAERILAAYPDVTKGSWDGTTYINQKNKYALTSFEDPLLQQVFAELNSERLLSIISEITKIDDLKPDAKLFGGGLHQSLKGAFLDVHVDFNYHPETKQHRRLNILIYMNKDWTQDYNGFLELWDLPTSQQLAYIAPDFNRCVIFETNEVSFHGHPKPLNTPPHISRKSIAAYYYTDTRPAHEIAGEHNTVYVNTEGLGGNLKNIKSGMKAFLERVNKKG